MALPKSLQREADQAQLIQQSLTQQAENATAAIDSPDALLAANGTAEPPQPASPAPAPTPAPTQTQNSAEYWEQRFKTVTGMVQREVPQLRDQLRAANEAISSLRKELDDARKPVAEAPIKASVDPKDVEAFGADMIDMVQRHAQQTYQSLSQQLAAKFTALETRVGAIEQQVQGVGKKSESVMEAQFYATLNALVPDWERVNQDERWLAWLEQTDPVYGAPRQAALDAAHQKLDAQRVASVFKAFKATLPPIVKNDSLAAQVAPSGAASAPPSPTPNKPIITQKFIEDFFNDVAKGKWNKRPQEAARIEAEINTALVEGRVR